MSALERVWEHYEGGRLRESSREQNVKCPLHQDSSPSARVNLDKGLWFCNVCTVGGDVYKLIQLVEKVSFPEAKRIAEERFGDDAPASTKTRKGRKGGSWRPSWL